MSSLPKQRVLICPQHWGLGHVTRSIPIIRYFIEGGHEVFLASSGAANTILKNEFPGIPVFELADYKINYPSKNMYFNMAYQLFKMHKAIINEHFQIKKLIRQYDISLLISDARLGAAQSSVPSVIVSHHLHFPLANRFFEWWSDNWMRFFYQRFDQLWIPDYEGSKNLSGVLAHGYKSKKAYFIGAVSRFKKLAIEKKYDIAIVLSGPEPQRTYLENIICRQLSTLTNKKIILVRGVSDTLKLNVPYPDSLTIKHLVYSQELNEIMSASDLIICRSGYTSLLDLTVIGKRALVIPTPGQPEQIYLAEALMENNLFFMQHQDSLNLEKDIPKAMNYSGYNNTFEAIVLKDRLEELLLKLFN